MLIILLFSLFTASFTQTSQKNDVYFSRTQSLSFRLHPHTDIMQGMTDALLPHKLSAVSIVTAVGSVYSCWLRLANNSFFSHFDGPFEITSLTGTFDKDMQTHIHIQLANSQGLSIGGHLPSLSQRNSSQLELKCPIYTTLQLVLLYHRDIVYTRKIDPDTKCHELIQRLSKQSADMIFRSLIRKQFTTVFDKILAKTIPSSIVYEDELIYAFDDINPCAPVHVLIIPKQKQGLSGISMAEQRHQLILGHMLVKINHIAKLKGLSKGGRWTTDSFSFAHAFNRGKENELASWVIYNRIDLDLVLTLMTKRVQQSMIQLVNKWYVLQSFEGKFDTPREQEESQEQISRLTNELYSQFQLTNKFIDQIVVIPPPNEELIQQQHATAVKQYKKIVLQLKAWRNQIKNKTNSLLK